MVGWLYIGEKQGLPTGMDGKTHIKFREKVPDANRHIFDYNFSDFLPDANRLVTIRHIMIKFLTLWFG